MINISAATTAELVAFYNAHAATFVKRFSDRKTAERRCAALVAAMPAPAPAPAPAPTAVLAAYTPGTCPKCGADYDITCGTVVEVHGRQHLTKEHEALCHSCGHEFNYETGRALRRAAPSAKRSAGVARSWTDVRVAAARAERHGVRVTTARGGEDTFRSVREAFVALGLPLAGHIKFRGALKARGALEDASGLLWSIVPRAELRG